LWSSSLRPQWRRDRFATLTLTSLDYSCIRLVA
jgi:hypothetical protein